MASPGVSPTRRRVTRLVALAVVAVLGVTVWQTWDFWRETASEWRDRPAPRRGRGSYPPGGGYYGRGQPHEDEADGLDWELRDRVRTALEIQDERDWDAIEPKVVAVVRLQEQLPESKDPLSRLGPARGAGGPAQPTTDAVASVRDDRARLRLQLKQARDDLRKSVTRRQEAALVLLGLLD
jgi:hypothetical protein